MRKYKLYFIIDVLIIGIILFDMKKHGLNDDSLEQPFLITRK